MTWGKEGEVVKLMGEEGETVRSSAIALGTWTSEPIPGGLRSKPNHGLLCSNSAEIIFQKYLI